MEVVGPAVPAQATDVKRSLMVVVCGEALIPGDAGLNTVEEAAAAKVNPSILKQNVLSFCSCVVTRWRF